MRYTDLDKDPIFSPRVEGVIFGMKTGTGEGEGERVLGRNKPSV